MTALLFFRFLRIQRNARIAVPRRPIKSTIATTIPIMAPAPIPIVVLVCTLALVELDDVGADFPVAAVITMVFALGGGVELYWLITEGVPISKTGDVSVQQSVVFDASQQYFVPPQDWSFTHVSSSAVCAQYCGQLDEPQL